MTYSSKITINQTKVWLTIGIPTYRRPDQLNICINRINQNTPFELRDQIEIIVVDNDSNSYESATIIEICNKSLIKCRYLSGNLVVRTAESSITIIEDNSNGVYVWFLGDDDYVSTSLKELFNIFKKRPDMILIQYQNLNLTKLWVASNYLSNLKFKNLVKLILHYRLGFLSFQIYENKINKENKICYKYRQMAFLEKSIRIVNASKKIMICNKTIFVDSPTLSKYSSLNYHDIFYYQVMKSLHKSFIARLGFIFWSIVYYSIPYIEDNGQTFKSNIRYPLINNSTYNIFLLKRFLILRVKKLKNKFNR